MARTRMAAGLLAASMLVLAACSSDGGGAAETPGTASSEGESTSSAAPEVPDEEVELRFTWWGNDDRATRYNEALDLFTETYPNITVVRSFNAWDDYWTARSTEAAGRSLPDVMQTDIAYLGQYADQGLLLDLTPYLGGIVDTSEYSDTLLGSGTVDDALIGIPVSTTSLAIHYNKDLLDELGVEHPADDLTWEELNAYLAEVNAAGGAIDPSVFGMGDYTYGFPGFHYHLMQEGKPDFDDAGQAAFTREDVVEWLDQGAELREAGGFFPIDRSIAIAPLTSYSSGQAALSLEWSTMISSAMADLGTENLGIVPPPFGSDAQARGVSEKPGMLVSVATNTDHPEAAALLADFLANDPEVAAIFGTSRGVPATASARDAIDPTAADAIVIAYQESIADDLTATFPVPPAGYGALSAKWQELHEELQYGIITTEEFADLLFAEMALMLG